MKTFSFCILLAVVLVFGQSCAKRLTSDTSDNSLADGPPGGITVLADNPNAHLSEVLQRLRGRWIKELADPNLPDPSMMRLFSTADNLLTGRLLIAGAFDDTGVAATLKEEPDGTFTLTLTDDELRPHDSIPKTRTLTGTFDKEKNELSLKSAEGEYIVFDIPGGFSLKFSANLFQCHMMPVSIPGASGASGATTVVGTPPGGGNPWGIPTSGTPGAGPDHGPVWSEAPATNGGHAHHSLLADTPIRASTATTPAATPSPRTPAASPAPSPAPGVPTARLTGCGITSYNEDTWSRMSGAGLD